MGRAAQLSLDELDDRAMHRLVGLEPTDTGYRARCSCGRAGADVTSKAQARADNLSHVARTPYGRAQYRRLYR